MKGHRKMPDLIFDSIFDRKVLRLLNPEELAELDILLAADAPLWQPLPGPQLMAYLSSADIIGYGGAAGGGKTDLACGKALMQHRKVLILRREATQLTGIIDRLTELLGSRTGFNGQQKIWRLASGNDGKRGEKKQIELGSTPNVGDWSKYQGRPHDLLVFDEAANFLESQVRALIGWVRSVDPKQKCQTLLTFNPPTTAEGRWVVDFFAPWLDRKFHHPARAGEIRYTATVPGSSSSHNGSREIWLEKPASFVLVKGKRVYDFDPADFELQDIIKPKSRTFIPSRVSDNPYLMETDYMLTLQSLPEPLRSQMLHGDFNAGVQDDPWQVIPTAWVEAAQARWKRPDRLEAMSSMGVDVARGGADSTIIARRHGMWFDVPIAYPGAQTPDGPSTAGLVIAARRNNTVVHIDVIGVGSSPYDFLRETGIHVLGVNVAESAGGLDRSGRLGFRNLRSELWWHMREALDPVNNTGIALPPDRQLLADLCAPTWSLSGATIAVASREEIVKKIGRSPDYGSAYILALMDTPKVTEAPGYDRTQEAQEYDPYG